MNKTMKLLLIPVAAFAFAGGLAACDGDDETPADPVPTTVVTSEIPDPDEPPVVVSPSTSISVSPSPSVSVSVKEVPSTPPTVPGGDGPDNDGGPGDRPAH